jgi:hypothetical protein
LLDFLIFLFISFINSSQVLFFIISTISSALKSWIKRRSILAFISLWTQSAFHGKGLGICSSVESTIAKILKNFFTLSYFCSLLVIEDVFSKFGKHNFINPSILWMPLHRCSFDPSQRESLSTCMWCKDDDSKPKSCIIYFLGQVWKAFQRLCSFHYLGLFYINIVF